MQRSDDEPGDRHLHPSPGMGVKVGAGDLLDESRILFREPPFDLLQDLLLVFVERHGTSGRGERPVPLRL